MKLLMFHVAEWWYRTASKSVPDVPDVLREESTGSAVVIFFHAEQEDEAKGNSVAQKMAKNIKWIAGKFGTKNVVIHSFNHLSASKASPQFAQGLLSEVRTGLERNGYAVLVTPFGYFNEFRMHVTGESLAKVFKEF